ncbi:MAG: hypothetical protein EBS05_09015 [Proteobacteria bacterium]|nr:hypothetical protein [Pseudomonadota bacterium]
MNMKRANQLGWLLAAVLAAAVTVRADVVGDYKIILERNPFGLKPPPAPVIATNPPPPEVPTNYKLSGITALFKPARAMFVNQVPGKPTPEYISLSEGQRQGSLEVLAGGIDLKRGSVRVKISGEERTLSFEKDGLKAAAGPAMPGPGGAMPMNPVPARPGGGMAMPTPIFPVPPANPAGNQQQPLPGRFGVPGGAGLPGAGGVVPVDSTPSPTRPLRTIPVNGATSLPTPPDHGEVDPLKQGLLMEANKIITAPAVANGQLPPLPPTDFTGK